MIFRKIRQVWGDASFRRKAEIQIRKSYNVWQKTRGSTWRKEVMQRAKCHSFRIYSLVTVILFVYKEDSCYQIVCVKTCTKFLQNTQSTRVREKSLIWKMYVWTNTISLKFYLINFKVLYQFSFTFTSHLSFAFTLCNLFFAIYFSPFILVLLSLLLLKHF